MFDDDDGVEPQFEDVNEYYFENGKEKPVCFSILPFQFDENDKVIDCNIKKNVFLRGVADKSLCVYKKVIAWKMGLDSEKPNIYVLSIEKKWIKLLKPRKCYGEFVRSVLITAQMLHYVRKRDQRGCLDHLWDHLDEVFCKYDSKPTEDDLTKHYHLIKLFVEKDLTLMKSKILRKLIENGFERTKKALGPEVQFIVNKQNVRKNNGNHYHNEDNNGDASDDDGGSDDDDEDDSSDDDGTDQICAICDDGGELLSCEGPCKRSFHPTKEDGRESKCKTLGYTSAEVERMGTFLCENCKNWQHQCFRCGELEPSHGPNAKVFQCNKESCGYFYHPKCIAQLLDPNATDGAYELERKITEGMSFSCSVHWCFKCGIMETKTQKELKLALCRRCPKAYHLKCLPREISFKTEDKGVIKRAWKLSKTILIYCLDHKIDKATRTARRNHIKFPSVPEGGNSIDRVRVTGKRKNNTDQSAKYIESPDMLHREERKQAHSEAQHAAKRMKGYPQFEHSMVGAASQNGSETVEGHKKKFGISSSYATGKIPRSSSSAVSTETEKRATCMAEKARTLYDVSWKYDVPSVQTPMVDKDAELGNVICRITEGKDENGEKARDDCPGKERDAAMKFHKNEKQNDVLAKLYMDKQADGSQLESGKGRENGHALESISGQKKGTSIRENSRSDRETISSDDSNKFYSRCGKLALGHVDHAAVKQVQAADVKKVATKSRVGTNRVCRPDHKEVNESCLHQNEPNCSKCGDKSGKRREPVEMVTDNKVEFDKNNKHNLMEDGRDAHYEDERAYRNTAAAADTSKYKHRGRSQLDRTEELVGRNDRTRSRSHSLERTDHCDREPWSHVNSSINDRYDRSNPYEGGRSDKNTEADISKYKRRGRWESDRREEPVKSNSQRRSRKHSRERQLIDCHGSYSGINNGHKYEPTRHVKSSMNDHDVWRQHSRHSSFPAEFGTSRRHTPSPNLEDGEYRISQKRISPSYTRKPEHGSSRRRSPPPYPRRSEDVDYTRDHSTSRDLQYDKYNSMHQGYHKVDIDPVFRYSSQDREARAHGAGHAWSAGRYGERSGYVYRNVSNWRSQA